MMKARQLSPEQIDALRGTEPLDQKFWWALRNCPTCTAEALDTLLVGLLLRKKPRKSRGPHLDDVAAASLVEGTLSLAELPAVFHHLAHCDACLAEVGELRLAMNEARYAMRARRLDLDDQHLERAVDALMGQAPARRLGRLKLVRTAAGAIARFVPLVRKRAASTFNAIRHAYHDALGEASFLRELDPKQQYLRDNMPRYQLQKMEEPPVFENPALAAFRAPEARTGETRPRKKKPGPKDSVAESHAQIDVGELQVRISPAGSPAEPQLQIFISDKGTERPAPGVYLNLEADKRVIASSETDDTGACSIPLLPDAQRLRIETDEGTWTIDL